MTSRELFNKLKPIKIWKYPAQHLVDGLSVNLSDMFSKFIEDAFWCTCYRSDLRYDMEYIDSWLKNFNPLEDTEPIWLGFRDYGVDGTQFVLSKAENEFMYGKLSNNYFKLYSIIIEHESDDFYNIVVREYQMRHIIWTNEIDFEKDWKDDLRKLYPDSSENELMEIAYDINQSYLDDERENLDKELGRPIIIFGSIHLWNGTRDGYKILKGENLNDCLDGTCGDCVRDYGENHEFKCTDAHHDGTNIYTYRLLKKDFTTEDFEEYAFNKSVKEAVEKFTEPMGDYVREIYGWEE